MRPTFDSMGFTPEEAMDSLSEDVVEAEHEIDRLRAALQEAEAERDALQARVNAYLNALDALNDFDHGEDSDLRTRSELVFRLSDREDALRAGKEGKR